MKKKILCAALATAAILSCAACNGSGAQTTTQPQQTEAPTQTEAAASFTAADVTAAVLAEIPISSAFEKGKDTLDEYFDDLDTEKIADFSFYICASGAYPDEIAVFKFTSDSDASAAVSSVQKRLEYQTEEYETYTPKEFYKLENAVVKQSGEYVYYLVTSDNEKAEQIVKTYIK